MSGCTELKKEFQRGYFGFNHDFPKLFVLTECGPRLLYPFWTGFWLLWHLSWFVVDSYNSYKDSGTGDKYYFIYLTNWGYIFLGISNLVDFICTIYIHFKRKDAYVIHLNNKTGEERNSMPWYLKLDWMLFELSSTIAVIITVAFYGLLSPSKAPTSIAKHGLNSVYVLLNIFVCAKPIRILHIIYPFIFGILYGLFSLIYQVAGGGAAIYPVLDWHKPGKTILYVFMLLFVGILVIHTVLFASHKLRIYIHDNCCNGTVQNGDQTNTIELNSVCKEMS